MHFQHFFGFNLSVVILLQWLNLQASAQDPFQHEPGVEISDEDVNATFTHLVGFEECDRFQTRDMVQAFWDAAGVLNRDEVRNNIAWNSPAAVEFLGAPFTVPFRITFQDLYRHAATFEPSSIPWPTDFQLNTRCDDPLGICRCRSPDDEDDDETFAYTVQRGGSNGDGPFINFCEPFFTLPGMSLALQQYLTGPPEVRFDLETYENQAEIFLHEMFHVDKIANSPPIPHVTDLYVEVDEGMWRAARGPMFAKVLARTMQNTAQWVVQNADNLMWYAMASYYQHRLGGHYPSRPFAEAAPEGTPRYHRPHAAWAFEDGKAVVANSDINTDFAGTVHPASRTCNPNVNPAIMTMSNEPFAANSDFPADYQSSLSSWTSTWDAYWASREADPASKSAAPAIITTSPEQPVKRSLGRHWDA